MSYVGYASYVSYMSYESYIALNVIFLFLKILNFIFVKIRIENSSYRNKMLRQNT